MTFVLFITKFSWHGGSRDDGGAGMGDLPVNLVDSKFFSGFSSPEEKVFC